MELYRERGVKTSRACAWIIKILNPMLRKCMIFQHGWLL